MNVKKWVIASVVVFIVSQILDFIIHGVLLTGSYEATSQLWRTEAEMNQMMWLMWLIPWWHESGVMPFLCLRVVFL